MIFYRKATMQVSDFLVLYILIGFSGAQNPTPGSIEMAVVGVNYFMPLTHEMFFNSSIKESKYGVKYIMSTEGRPDLPKWLRVIHEEATGPAFLYGTPDSVDDTSIIEMTAIDRSTNLVSHMTKKIKVNELSDQARYFVDLTIRNLELGEMFARDLLNDILVRMRRIWPSSGNIYITSVATLTEVGERLPVPETPAAAKILKDGVRIRVGGTGDFSNRLKQAEKDLREACRSGKENPFVSINEGFQPDFDIDWCKYKLINRETTMMDITPAPAHIVLSGQEVDLSTVDIPRRNLTNDFYVTVVFPILLALALSVLLSVFFFCSRQGTERRDEMTSETQLSQFNTIRRATTNLRLMSQRRDGPPPLSSSQQHNTDREPSTLPRTQPPPPYRLPPSYPADDSTSAPDGESSSPQRFEEGPTAEDVNLVPRTSTRRAGNDNMGQQSL